MSQSSNGLGSFLRSSASKARRFRFKGRDMQTQMAELAQAAAITRALHFQSVPGDPVAGKNFLKQQLKDADNFLRRESTDPEDMTRLEKLIEQIEEGYNNPTKPYGNPPEQRPRIRIAGRGTP
jgi:hypothetical protein